ncbi:MAG: hypothetical protein ABIZ49_09955, partial [Opitutaceae bacterium]
MSSLPRRSLRAVLIAVSLAMLFSSAPLPRAAENAADPALADAASALASISSEFDTMKPGDVETGQRLMKQLAPIGTRLGTMSNRTSPTWKETAAKYNALNTAIPAKARSSASAASAGTPDPSIAQLDGELAAYDQKLATMPPGDLATGSSHLAELKTLGPRIGAVTSKSHPSYSALVKRYNALNVALAEKANRAASASARPLQKAGGPALSSMQQTQFNRLSREIARSISIVSAASEPDLLNAPNVQSWRTAAGNHRVNLENIGRSDRPEVVA